MAAFKVVTQQVSGMTYAVDEDGYQLEMEALAPIDAEIVEVAAQTETAFINAARDADAIIVKGRRITKTIIDNLEQCNSPFAQIWS